MGRETAEPTNNPSVNNRYTPTYQGSYQNMFNTATTAQNVGGGKGTGAPLSNPTFKPIPIDTTKASLPSTTAPLATEETAEAKALRELGADRTR